MLTTGFIPSHPKTFIGVIREAINAGVEVKLLANRDLMDGPEKHLTDNVGTVAAINALIGGKRGEAIVDPVLRETSSHHQKTSFVRSADGVTAFIGGIDQIKSRWAGDNHDQIDPDRPEMYSLWHDVHLLIQGKAVWDVFRNFKQRWDVAKADPRVKSEGVIYSSIGDVLTEEIVDPAITNNKGTVTVQINRTLPPHLPALRDMVNPEEINDSKKEWSILRSYKRTIQNARHHLYIEEQFFWNVDLASDLNARLSHPDGPSFLVLVLPKEIAEPPVDQVIFAMRRRALNMLLYGQTNLRTGEDPTKLAKYVADKVVVVHLQNDQNQPVYVHSKLMIADDVWMSIGSSNMNRRSMTYDSELNAASIDSLIRRGGHVSARLLRVRLMAEHLGLDKMEYPYVEDPTAAFEPFVLLQIISHQHGFAIIS